MCPLLDAQFEKWVDSLIPDSHLAYSDTGGAAGQVELVALPALPAYSRQQVP